MAVRNLWEILVPSQANDGTEYAVGYHHEWDAKVRQISGGLTILKSAKGQWISPDGRIFSEKMIPVRILCTEEEIDQVIQLTLNHYSQQAVFAYQVSMKVKIVHSKPEKKY